MSNTEDTVYKRYWEKYLELFNVYRIYYEKYGKSVNSKVPDKTDGRPQGGVDDSQKKNLEGNIKSVVTELHELRPTPGFTNYVVGVEKDLSGNISSASLKRYYSTIDCELYFNGHWVEDVEYISFNCQQETRPLFGYNSHLWDEVAQGVRMISGAFSVLFTKPQPLYDYVDVNGKNKKIEGSSVNTYEDVQARLKEMTVALARNDNSRLIYNGEHSPIWAKNFDLDIVCGEYDRTGGYPVHIILKNCYITSCSTVRDKNGEPAAEAYQFLARDFKTIQ